METTTNEVSNTKKYVIFGTVGTVLVLALVGAFVPDSRQYVTAITNSFMGAVVSILK